jgi:hypothetical protein
MNIPVNLLNNRKLSKWLLTVALFFSSLSFSGFVQAKSAQEQIDKTGLLLKTSLRRSERVVSCYSYLKYQPAFSFCCKPGPNAVVQFNRLVKIKFDYLAKMNFPSQRSAELLHRPVIYPFSEEEQLNS